MQFLVISIQSLSRNNLKNKVVLTLLVALFSFSMSFAQFEIPKKPEFQTSVYDYVNLLSASEKSNLEQKLIRYSDSTSTQIVVAIISSTQGEEINYLGAQWGEAWGMGQEKEDNGVLILLAKDDRKIAINTGYGVEHLLTDALSKRIIERDIIPYFKQNDYPGGLNRGVDAIFEVLKGEYKGTRKTSKNEEFPMGLIFTFVIIGIIIFSAISKNRRGGNGRNGGNRSGGFNLLDAIILSSLGRSSSGGSSSGGFGGGGSFGGGGGFGGGFGGGGFGGGGASGGW